MNQVTDAEVEAAALAIWVDANGWTPPDAQDRLTLPWSLCCRQARAALRTRPAVDEGMVLVPREPTAAMLYAWDQVESDAGDDRYAAMLAAAPTASPVQPGGETGDGWRTIDTAPKSGYIIGVWKDGKWQAAELWWDDAVEEWTHSTGDYYVKPTLWMPPPAPTAVLEDVPKAE